MAVYYPDPKVTDHGGTDTGSTQSILTAIGASKNATLVFRHSSGDNTTSYAFANSVTVPTNVAIRVEEGALLTIASGKTLTINGPFEAGLYQVFNGTGTVTFGSGSIKYQHTEWSGTAETITANDIILGGSGGIYTKSTVAENRILGRMTGGNIDDLTITQVLDMLSGATDGTMVYRSGGSWGVRTPIIFGTAVAATSGTYIEFTGIPSWAKLIIVNLNSVSLSGTDKFCIQIGGSSGVETSGYASIIFGFSAGSISTLNGTSGAVIGYVTDGAYIYSSTIYISLVSGTTWNFAGTFGRMAGSTGYSVTGTKTLSGTLDRVRITTENGTYAFDAGTINIMYI